MLQSYLQLATNKKALRGRQLLLFTGALKQHERLSMIQKVQQATNPPTVMLTTFQVGSTGHNLQNFDAILFLDRNWNPQVFKYMHKH